MNKHCLRVLTAGSFLFLAACDLPGSSERYIRRASQFANQGNWAEASINYRKVLQKDPANGEAWFQLALCERNRGNKQAAYTAFVEASTRAPHQEQARIQVARLDAESYLLSPSKSPDLRDRIASFAKHLLSLDPESFEGHRLLGFLLFADGNPSEALPHFERASRATPSEPDVPLALAQCLLLTKQPQPAESRILEILTSNPQFAPAYDVLYSQYVSTGRVQPAEDLLKRHVQASPSEPLAVIALARHYLRFRQTGPLQQIERQFLANPKFSDQWLQLGDLHTEFGDWPAADAYYLEGSAKTTPARKMEYEKRIIQALIGQHQVPEALQKINTLLAANGADLDLRGTRAFLLLESHQTANIEKALGEYTELVKLSPVSSVFRYNLARAHAALENWHQAKGQLRELLRQSPGDLRALLLFSEICLRTGEFQEAIQYADLALERDAQNSKAHLSRSAALAATGRLSLARTELNGLLRVEPQSTEAQLQLASIDLLEKHYRDAEAAFLRVSSVLPEDPRPLKGLIETYAAQNQWPKALNLLNNAVRRFPKSAPIQQLFGLAAAQTGNVPVAVQAFETAISLNPSDASSYASLGNIFVQQRNLSRGLEMLRKSVAIAPKNIPARMLLAGALESTANPTDAIAQYRAVLATDPENAPAMNNLADLLARTGGNLDEALTLAQRALQIAPGTPEFADTVGTVHLKKRNTAAAMPIFLSLVQKYPSEPWYRYHLALSLQGSGDFSAAVTHLRAIKVSPETEIGVKVRSLLRELGASASL